MAYSEKQDQFEKQEYVKPLLTTVEIAARELLGTGEEPPPEP